jgi:hypothetical protein
MLGGQPITLIIGILVGVSLTLTTIQTNNLIATTDENCDPSYPDVCIVPPSPDLNCDDVPYKDIKVEGIDPHGFDRDGDGIGCES